MNNPEKMVNGGNHHHPPLKSAAHHAIKIIPEDVELSSGMHRSRSSSVQLHLPLLSNSPASSSSSSLAGHPSVGGGAIAGAAPGPGSSSALNNPHGLLLASNSHLRAEISPPLPSPSLTKPFRQHPHPGTQARARRRHIVLAVALITGALTFVLLFVVFSSPSGTAGFGPEDDLSYSSSSAAARLRQQALGLSSSPSSGLTRLSSYLGSYLPFLDTNSAALSSLTSSALLFGYAAQGVQHSLHPILPVLRSARAVQQKLVSRQSTTLSAATAEYKRRYKQDPPRGFDKWWSFAKSRNHTMVDEYDSMMRDLRMYASLSPEVLRQRTRTLAQVPGVSLISIRGGQAQIHTKSGKWAPALALQEMMNAFVSILPDMEIAINEKQEGRILPIQWKEVKADEWGEDEFPQEVVSLLNQTDPLADLVQKGLKSDWRRDGSVWETFRRSCPPDSAARRLVESVRSAETATNSRQMRLQVPSAAMQQQSDVIYASSLSRRRAESSGALPRTRELTFSRDLDAKLDVCHFPSLHALHSAFFSDTRSIGYLYPLFSPSKASGFADLLIPFHQYWAPPSEVTYENDYRKGRTKQPADLDWEQKDDKVFWRGKVTRGADTPPGHFTSFQKPRLVHLANDDGSTWTGREGTPERKRVLPRVPPHRVLVTVNATTSSLVSMSAPGPKINEYVMDVALACDPALGECAEQQRLGYKVVVPGPLSESYKHKYVIDLDEIGLSPRFPAMMESKAAVVKSSMQREFWQDWIVPWYHFIPLSSSYAELFNIQAFFSGFPKAFQNRRSTSHSAPKKDDSAKASGDKSDGSKDDASGVAVDLGVVSTQPEEEIAAEAVTIKSEAISLKPINPAHGEIFNGDLALRDIAEQGSQWKREHLRREDMEVYVFRLLLEWARLTTDDPKGTTKKGAARRS